MNEKIILVKYCGGEYDDFYTSIVFATNNIKTAKKYIAKFNKILKKWKRYYSKFEQGEGILRWIKEEYSESHYDRWYRLRNIDKCYFEEVEIRE